jgi:hypothetical protein
MRSIFQHQKFTKCTIKTNYKMTKHKYGTFCRSRPQKYSFQHSIVTSFEMLKPEDLKPKEYLYHATITTKIPWKNREPLLHPIYTRITRYG